MNKKANPVSVNLGGAILRRALTNLDAADQKGNVHWKHQSICDPRSFHSPLRVTTRSEEKSGLYRVSRHLEGLGVGLFKCFANRIGFSLFLILTFLLLTPSESHAQWLTQTFELKGGWNAIFTHVDASHDTLDAMVGLDVDNPIEEVWLWKPAVTSMQFVTNPQEPLNSGTQWASWKRNVQGNSLQRLIGNQAYLVKVVSSTTDYAWNVKGQPVPPRYTWTSSGLNFLGFQTTPSDPPSFEDFLAKAPALRRNAEIFYYTGGPLGESNPAPLFALRTTPVARGQAVWIRSGKLFNRYFGPFELNLQSNAGLLFRDSLGKHRLRLRNLVAEELTVTAELISSETPPDGQTAIVGVPRLLLRGALDTSTLTYGHTDFADGTQSWTLKPKGQVGSEVEIVIGIDRFQMQGNPGDLFAGVLRVTDSLGFSQVDVPISATLASTSGLWIGDALVNQVQHRLVAYEKDSQGNLVQDANGKYVPTAIDNSVGGVARNYPFRLIVHNNDQSQAVLLQRVFFGLDPQANIILSTKESALANDTLESARRMSAVHFPWTKLNNPWPITGALRQGETLTATIALAHDAHASNPFLHTYHPDHDNQNATFSQSLPVGFESFGITRDITLAVKSPADDFASRTSGNLTLSGDYQEIITLHGAGTESRQYQVQGAFALNRVSEIETLKTQ